MNSYFCVVAETYPWGSERFLRAYNSQALANKASNFVREVYMETLIGGIDVRVKEYAGKIITTQAGLRLENTRGGALITIETTFDKEEYIHLLNLSFEHTNQTKTQSHPKTISAENYACVKVRKGEKESVAGYYQTDNIAAKAFFFLDGIKSGSNLTFSISRHEGTLVISDSGKKWLETADKMEEVKSKLDLKEYRRLVEIGEEKPIAWGTALANRLFIEFEGNK